jgi:hypothetical protein
MKRDKIDDIFSKLVRERAGYTCEHSGRYYPPGIQRRGCHCSHLYSRRNTATRWHPDNAFCHSYASHQYLGENPVEFRDWALHLLGSERFNTVKELANDGTLKFTKSDKAELYQDLKRQYAEMEEKRNDGIIERIEFTNLWFQ